MKVNSISKLLFLIIALMTVFSLTLTTASAEGGEEATNELGLRYVAQNECGLSAIVWDAQPGAISYVVYRDGIHVATIDGKYISITSYRYKDQPNADSTFDAHTFKLVATTADSVKTATITAASEHVWGNDWLADEDAGTHYHGCDCGARNDEEAHIADEKWENDSDADTHYHKCTVCSDDTNVRVDEEKHDWSELRIDDEKDQHYRECSVCAEDYKDRGAHTYENHVKNEGEDTHTGTCACTKTSVEDCSVGTNGKEANCVELAVCGTCSGEFGAVDSNNHKDFDREVVADDYLADGATCTKKADYYYSCHCALSSEGRPEEKTFPYGEMLPHTFDAEIADDKYLADPSTSCTQNAAYYKSCSVCGISSEGFAEENTFDEDGTTLPHQYSEEWSYDEENGTHYHKCVNCDARDGEEKHVYSYGQIDNDMHEGTCICEHKTVAEDCSVGENGTAADCINKAICGVCVTEFGVVDTENHIGFNKQVTSDTYSATPADCENAATYFYSCACGAKGTETFVNEGSELGHDFYSEWSYDTEAGTHYHACSRCDVRNDEDNHSFDTFEKLTGKNEHCGVCSCGYKSEISEACSVGANGTPASCIKAATCGACGSTYGSADKTAHIGFTQENALSKYLVSDATCTEPAIYKHSCACGEAGETTFEHGTALNHSFGEWIEELPASCVDSGTKAHYLCATCRKAFDANEEIISNLVIPALPHNLTGGLITGAAATCLDTGVANHYDCPECGNYIAEDGETVLDTVVIPANGHTLGNWIEHKPATCTASGTKAHYVCSACKKNIDSNRETVIFDITIKATGHNMVSVEAKAGTCEEIGWFAHETCTKCDYSTKTEIPATGHQYSYADTNVTGTIRPSCVYCQAESTEESKFTISTQHKGLLIFAAVLLVSILVIVFAIKRLKAPATTTPWWRRMR